MWHLIEESLSEKIINIFFANFSLLLLKYILDSDFVWNSNQLIYGGSNSEPNINK